jgi:hypothetical protein
MDGWEDEDIECGECDYGTQLRGNRRVETVPGTTVCCRHAYQFDNLSLEERMVEKMRMLSAVRVTMGPSSVVTSGWKLYSTVVYLQE